MATAAASRESMVAPAATVFIVDDDADVRQAVSLLIRSVGLVEDSYASAEEFLDNLVSLL